MWRDVGRTISECIQEERAWLNSPGRRLGSKILIAVGENGLEIHDATFRGRFRSYKQKILEAAKKK